MDTPSPAPAPARNHRRTLLVGLAALGIVSTIGAAWYLVEQSKYVYTDKAEVAAPLIKLTAQAPGTLNRVSVSEGDWLYPGEPVARVGDQILQTKVSGIAVAVKKDIGAHYSPNDAVVTMVEPRELRVVARVEEDKGLKDVYEGQKAIFTLDAFGSQRFEGVVESVSDTSREGDVVFNISDKRQTKEFDVKIRFAGDLATKVQNGMSAKVWIVK